VRVLRGQTHRAAGHVPRWQIGGALLMGMSGYYTPRNYVHNLSDRTYVRSKIYQEFYYGIIYIAKEGRHIKIVVFLSVFVSMTMLFVNKKINLS
jgi:hypothetical protein